MSIQHGKDWQDVVMAACLAFNTKSKMHSTKQVGKKAVIATAQGINIRFALIRLHRLQKQVSKHNYADWQDKEYQNMHLKQETIWLLYSSSHEMMQTKVSSETRVLRWNFFPASL